MCIARPTRAHTQPAPAPLQRPRTSSRRLPGAPSLYTAQLVCPPAPDLGDARLLHGLDPDVSRLATCRRVRASDHLPFAALIRQPVTELEIHGMHTYFGGSLLLVGGFGHPNRSE